MAGLLLPLLFLLGGILLMDFAELDFYPALTIALILIPLGLTLICLQIRGKLPTKMVSLLKTLGSGLFFFSVGIISASLFLHEPSRDHPRLNEFVAGLRTSEVAQVSLQRKNVDAFGDRWQCKIIEVSIVGEYAADSLAWLRKKRERFVGAETEIRVGVRDFRQGDILQLPAKNLIGGWCGPSEIKLVGHRSSIMTALGEVRDRFHQFVGRSHLEPQTKAFICVLLSGDRSMLQSRVTDTFADAGISHILAVSGMHVGIAAVMFYALLFPVGGVGGWRRRRLIALLPVWGFALFSGMSDSSVRAAVMLSICFLSYNMERHRNPLNALLAAAFLILLFEPGAWREAGFLLSFFSVGCIVLFVKPLNRVDERRYPYIYKICNAFLVPLVATAGTWALTSWFFGRIPLAFLPLNLLVIPLLPLYVALALLFLGLAAIGWESQPLGWLLDEALRLINKLAEVMGAGGQTVVEYKVSLFVVLFWLLLLILMALLLNPPGRRPSLPDETDV